MLKEVILVLFAVVALSLAFPAEEALDGQPKTTDPEVSPLEAESLEGAESANPQWGRRGWGGGWGGGYSRGWGGGYGRGWGGGGGRGWGGGWGGGWRGGWRRGGWGR